MAGCDPIDGVPPVDRYSEDQNSGRGGAGQYRQLPATLEEEAMAGGWLPGATPTGPNGTLDRLYTTGMRGEPGYDDDPHPMMPYAGKYAPVSPSVDLDNSSYD